MGLLDILFLKHNTWLKYVKSFGCPTDIAEDYVQEMYIKIHTYYQKNGNDLMYNENEINHFFVYVTLKNIYYDSIRKTKMVNVPLDGTNEIDVADEDYSEVEFNLKINSVHLWKQKLEKEIESITVYNRKKASLCYFHFIYTKIFEENMSVSELSREVGITYWSLRNTILLIKEQIKDEI